MDSLPITRIAIIGAGAAGITQAKQLVDAWTNDHVKTHLQVVVFEARDRVGGVWIEDPHPAPPLVRSDSVGKLFAMSSEPGVRPSPIYPGLRTNLPKQLMSYRNQPFPENIPIFPHASEVCTYLQTCAQKWDVQKYIRFHTAVRRVRRSTVANGKRWLVDFEDLENGALGSEAYDFVSVANGHYEKANLPEIPGLSEFTGKIVHSRWYREPEEYIGQRVLVVGAFASGSDIARELAMLNLPTDQHALPTPASSRPQTPQRPRTHVYQSSSGVVNLYNAPGDDAWRQFVELHGMIERIEGNLTIFKDGSELTGIDTIIFATGYEYFFPFFKVDDEPWLREERRLVTDVVGDVESVRPEVDKGGLRGLGMKHLDELMMFLQGDRSMALLGLVYQVVPFPLFEIQSHLVALLWSGRLPDFPANPNLPPHPRDDQPTSLPSPPSEDDGSPSHPLAVAKTAPPAKKRYTEIIRGALVFGFPYEYTYSNYLLGLCAPADGGEEEGWGKVEDWRWDLRRDTGLRRRTLGY